MTTIILLFLSIFIFIKILKEPIFYILLAIIVMFVFLDVSLDDEQEQIIAYLNEKPSCPTIKLLKKSLSCEQAKPEK